MKPEFWDALVRRLQAGECPDALCVELGVGVNTMKRYVSHASRRRVIGPPKANVGRAA